MTGINAPVSLAGANPARWWCLNFIYLYFSQLVGGLVDEARRLASKMERGRTARNERARCGDDESQAALFGGENFEEKKKTTQFITCCLQAVSRQRSRAERANKRTNQASGGDDINLVSSLLRAFEIPYQARMSRLENNNNNNNNNSADCLAAAAAAIAAAAAA
jgi:hypothetical protein